MAENIDSEEDDDLKRAIALSLEMERKSQVPMSRSSDSSGEKMPDSDIKPENKKFEMQSSNATVSASSSSILGLDRKKMEEERLARLATSKKRKTDALDEESGNEKRQRLGVEKFDSTTLLALANRTGLEWSTATTALPPANPTNALTSSDAGKTLQKNGTGNQETKSHCLTLQYPKGVIKKTWSKYHPRDNDIKIEEVLQKDHLRIAVLSSFMWDLDWIFNKLDMPQTNVLLVMAAKTEAERDQYTREAREQGLHNLRMCFPPMEGQVQSMHSKLMLLSYTESLRIVIPSANLVPYDWGETGVMENTVFLIDLPRLKDGTELEAKDLTFFGQELLHFLQKMGVAENVERGILRFDFSSTEHLAFIHSVGAANFGKDLERTGFAGLGRSVQELGLQATDLEIEYATASLGSLNDGLLNSLYKAAKGKPIDKATGRGKANKTNDDASARAHFRIYFPTLKTVQDSLGGPDNAGTICLREDWFSKSTFPKDVLRDHISTRSGLLSHSKIMLAYSRKQRAGWAYVGSANLSESAWGKLVQDVKRKETKLVCRNWECGVLIPVSRSHEAGTADEKVQVLFKSLMDVPFEIPARPHEGMEPWFFMKGRH